MTLLKCSVMALFNSNVLANVKYCDLTVEVNWKLCGYPNSFVMKRSAFVEISLRNSHRLIYLVQA